MTPFWSAFLVFSAIPPLSQPLNGATLAIACQAPISSVETLERLMPVLSAPLYPALPVDALKHVDTQPRRPARYGEVQVVASVTTGMFRPIISWTPSATGASILHELVHVSQRRLEGATLRGVVSDVRRHDIRDGFPSYVVTGATNSTLVSIQRMLPEHQGRVFHVRASRMLQRHAPAAGPRALEQRYHLLRSMLRDERWKRAREGLQATRPARIGWASRIAGEAWSWEDELRAKLFLEAMAYDADARCVRGQGPRFLL